MSTFEVSSRGHLVVRSSGAMWSYPVTLGPAIPWVEPEYEPPLPTRLRSLADAEIEAAKNGTRTQKAAAKAAARAYRLAADMIEEEA